MENSRATLLETSGWVRDVIVRPPTLNWSMGKSRELDRQGFDDEVVLGDMEMGKKKCKRDKSRQSDGWANAGRSQQ